MELSNTVTVEHVKEAHRIFTISTMNAATSGFSVNLQPPEELKDEIIRIEEVIQKRIAIGTSMSYPRLFEELGTRFGNGRAIEYVIYMW